jgi:hypothetical protein
MLLECESDSVQQAANAFQTVFEGGERELKAAQDAKADVLASVAGDSLGLALMFS